MKYVQKYQSGPGDFPCAAYFFFFVKVQDERTIIEIEKKNTRRNLNQKTVSCALLRSVVGGHCRGGAARTTPAHSTHVHVAHMPLSGELPEPLPAALPGAE